MIKDGYINVLGSLVQDKVEKVFDTDGQEIVLDPCPLCGGHDQELISEDIYEPSGYRLKCANPDCAFEVPEEIMDHAYFHDDGLRAAAKTWNAHASLVEVVNSGELIPHDDIPEEIASKLDELPEGYLRVEGKDGSYQIVNKETGEVM